MKFSESWLRQWVDPPIATDELAEVLTMAGLEVDLVTRAAPEFHGIVVGRVQAVAPHPDADKLRICQVDVGAGEPLQIVCGAPNVQPGMHAPTAKVGAQLPSGLEIKKAELRGQESQGMLCSASELGLAEKSAGLMALDEDAEPGTDIRQYLALDDSVIEIDLTPNRGDCLGLAGIAREVAALCRVASTPLEFQAVPPEVGDSFPVLLEAPEDCPRYLGRVLRDVDPTASTPRWMVERLRRSGVRSLGPLVDVTNYVMLELGQPLHAFDLSSLRGGVVVRRARAGEHLVLLDGTELTLDEELLLIADQERPLALAGIMGGEGSGCDDSTRDVFLESAFFHPLAIVGRARRFGLHTDASHRFERGVDPALQRWGIERATQLLVEITGGRPGPVIEAESERDLPARPPISLRTGQIERLLGMSFSTEQVEEMLGRLGMRMTGGPEQWAVTPPSFRFDVSIEADLIEEIGRMHGYNHLPTARPYARLGMSPQPESVLSLARLRTALVDRGYQEAVTYSFVDPQVQASLDPGRDPIALANPISSEMSVMRTSLWPGLLGALRYNLARQQTRVRLFESGLVFLRQEGSTRQAPCLGALVCGAALPEQWGEGARKVDFFDLKGDLEAMLDFGGNLGGTRFEAARHPALHPGRCARIVRDGTEVGWIGAIHPKVEKVLDLGTEVLAFEVLLDGITRVPIPEFRELSRFPSIRRDLAVVVDETVPYQSVRDCVARAGADLVRDVDLFDIYFGRGIDPGRKSLAISLILQAESRTLTDDEVETVIRRIIGRLEGEFNATLRK